MSQEPIDLTFGVWRTFRTGLAVARKKLLTLLALALVSLFVASQAAAGIANFASTFSLDLDLAEEALVFFGSLLLMWFAVVPLTIQAIESPSRTQAPGSLVERLWRDARLPYRTLSPHTFLRGLGLVLFNYFLSALSLLLSSTPIWAMELEEPPPEAVALLLGPVLGLLLSLVLLRWSVALPALIMEDLAIRQSLRRSWRMTRSRVLRLLGLGMLTTTLTATLGVLLGFLLGRLFLLFSQPTGDADNVLYSLAFFGGATVGLVVTAPIVAACYYYLRRD